MAECLFLSMLYVIADLYSDSFNAPFREAIEVSQINNAGAYRPSFRSSYMSYQWACQNKDYFQSLAPSGTSYSSILLSLAGVVLYLRC